MKKKDFWDVFTKLVKINFCSLLKYEIVAYALKFIYDSSTIVTDFQV